MTRCAKVYWLSSLLFLLTTPAVPARPSHNPYQDIYLRNVFDLRPKPPQRYTPPPPPAPKVTLSGITTILPNSVALLNVTFPSEPNRPAEKRSYILRAGQRDGRVEVLKIDPEAGSVTARIDGKVMVLTFEKNGPRLARASTRPMTRQPPIVFRWRR